MAMMWVGECIAETELESEARQSPIDFGYRIISEISDGFSRTLQGLLGGNSPQSRGEKLPKTPGKFNDNLSNAAVISPAFQSINRVVFPVSPAIGNLQQANAFQSNVATQQHQHAQTILQHALNNQPNPAIQIIQQQPLASNVPTIANPAQFSEAIAGQHASKIQSASFVQPLPSVQSSTSPKSLDSSLHGIKKPSIHLSLPDFSPSTNQVPGDQSSSKTLLNKGHPHAGHDHGHHGHDHGHHGHNTHHEHAFHHAGAGVPSHHSASHNSVNDGGSNTAGLLTQLLGTSGVLTPDTVIHLNTGTTDTSTEELSFKQMPIKDIKQKLHFGGWVGVPNDIVVNNVAFRNHENSLDKGLSTLLNSPITLKPIFVPADRLIPPFKSDEGTAIHLHSTSSLTNNAGRTAFGSNIVSNDGTKTPGVGNLFGSDNNLHHLSLDNTEPHINHRHHGNSRDHFLINGQLNHQNDIHKNPHHGGHNSGNSEPWDILSAFSKLHSPLPKRHHRSNLFIPQTLQLPHKDIPDTKFERLSFSPPTNVFNSIHNSNGKLIQNGNWKEFSGNGISLHQNDDTGSLSFTQIIDNADPSQIREAQKILTAIPDINVSELLNSIDNSTHMFDTQLVLKSLVSFRKKPHKIEGREDESESFVSLQSPTIHLNSFVTPPSINQYEIDNYNNFQSKQGPKLIENPLNKENALHGLKTSFEPPTMSGLVSSRGRRPREDTRFNKLSTYSRTDGNYKNQDLWAISSTAKPVIEQNALNQAYPNLSGFSKPVMNTRNDPPFLEQSSTNLFVPPNNQNILNSQFIQNGPWSHPLGSKREVTTNGNQLANMRTEDRINESTFNKDNSEAAVKVYETIGKTLIPPNLQLEPPIKGPSQKITPRPHHQFGSEFAQLISQQIELPNSEQPSNSFKNVNQFTTPIPIIEAVAGPVGFLSSTRRPDFLTNTLFQSQLANFTKIIVDRGIPQPIQSQTPQFNNIFGGQSNLVRNPLVQLPTSLSGFLQPPSSTEVQNVFRENNVFLGNAPTLSQINANGLQTSNIQGQVIPENNAFSFLENQRGVPSAIPIQPPQREITTYQNSVQSSNNFFPNIDIVTNFPVNLFKSVNTNSKNSNDLQNAYLGDIQSHPEMIGSESERAAIHNSLHNNKNGIQNMNFLPSNVNDQILGASSSIENESSFFDRFRTISSITTPPTISNHINSIEHLVKLLPPNADGYNTNILPFGENVQSNPSVVISENVYDFPFSKTRATTPHRLIPITSGISIQSLPSSIPGLTSNTVLGMMDNNPGHIAPPTNVLAEHVPRIIGRPQFTSSHPTFSPVTNDTRFSFGNDNVETTQNPIQETSEANSIVSFTPWPSRRLRGNPTEKTIIIPLNEVTTLLPKVISVTPWNPFASRLRTTTTTTTQQPVSVTTTTELPNRPTRPSIFEDWLKSRTLTTEQTIIEDLSTNSPTVSPNGEVFSSTNHQNRFQGPTKTWRRRIKDKTSFGNKDIPTFQVAETNIEAVSLPIPISFIEDTTSINLVTEDIFTSTVVPPTRRRRRFRPRFHKMNNVERQNNEEQSSTDSP